VPAYPVCPGKEAVKWVSVCLSVIVEIYFKDYGYVFVTVNELNLCTAVNCTAVTGLCLGADPDDVDASEPATAPVKQMPSKFVC